MSPELDSGDNWAWVSDVPAAAINAPNGYIVWRDRPGWEKISVYNNPAYYDLEFVTEIIDLCNKKQIVRDKNNKLCRREWSVGGIGRITGGVNNIGKRKFEPYQWDKGLD